MEEKIGQILTEATEALAKATNLAELEALRVKYLGKKGEFTAVMKNLGNLSAEERPKMGKIINEAKGALEQKIVSRKAFLAENELTARIKTEKIDVTLPGRPRPLGRLHPLTLTLNRIKSIFLSMGYTVEEGPEIETDYYNFEALNLPKDHPARDMQDSFYITEDILMRTQTSPVQARTMEKMKGEPIRMIAPGRVYRRDDYDATHSPMFTQVEGLVIDRDITFADLKGTLTHFLRQIFDGHGRTNADDEKAKVRFRPSFFPFTEPSTEVDVSCSQCGGSGCRVCKGTGWLEILGAGSIHPRVLEMSGYDPKKFQGFAFGLGVERIAMLSYGLDDLRLFYDNDVRFLEQF